MSDDHIPFTVLFMSKEIIETTPNIMEKNTTAIVIPPKTSDRILNEFSSITDFREEAKIGNKSIKNEYANILHPNLVFGSVVML